MGGGSENNTKAAFEDLLKNTPTLETVAFADVGIYRMSQAVAHYTKWQKEALVEYDKMSDMKGGQIDDALVKFDSDIANLKEQGGKDKEIAAVEDLRAKYLDGMTAQDKAEYEKFKKYQEQHFETQGKKWVAVVPALEGIYRIAEDPKGTAARVGITGMMDVIKFGKDVKTVYDQAKYAYDAKAWYDQIEAQMENAKKSSGQK